MVLSCIFNAPPLDGFDEGNKDIIDDAMFDTKYPMKGSELIDLKIKLFWITVLEVWGSWKLFWSLVDIIMHLVIHLLNKKLSSTILTFVLPQFDNDLKRKKVVSIGDWEWIRHVEKSFGIASGVLEVWWSEVTDAKYAMHIIDFMQRDINGDMLVILIETITMERLKRVRLIEWNVNNWRDIFYETMWALKEPLSMFAVISTFLNPKSL